MKKIQSLRTALTAALPELQTDPDRLRLWVEDGSASSRQTQSLGFGFTYRANLLIEEASTDIALIALPIFIWLRVHQPELLRPGAEGFSFEVDILDNRCADILIRLQLTENITVGTREEGGWDVNYQDEPDPLFDDGLPPWDLDDVPPFAAVTTEAHSAP